LFVWFVMGLALFGVVFWTIVFVGGGVFLFLVVGWEASVGVSFLLGVSGFFLVRNYVLRRNKQMGDNGITSDCGDLQRWNCGGSKAAGGKDK